MIVNEYAEFIRDIYEEAERIMLGKVARRLSRGVDQPGWAEKKLSEVQALRREIRSDIERLAARNAEIEEAIYEAYDGGAAVAAEEVGVSHVQVHVPESVRALAGDLTGAVQLTHLRILRSSEDIYRSVIAQAAGQSTAGTLTIREAVQAALIKFAEQGVTGFVDSRGRGWDLRSYTEMATRTATMNAYRQGFDDQLIAHGKDLEIISSHGSACPKCAPWEGKVISITGNTPDYPTLADAIAAGVFHPNCRHRKHLYTPGLTKVRKVKYDPEAYRARQKQREIERQIRKWKNREAVAIEPREQARCRAKIREHQTELREHIRTANLAGETRHGEGWITLKRRSDRERGLPLSESAKADVARKRDELHAYTENIQTGIRSGSQKLTYNKGHFEKHQPGSPAYEAYRQKVEAKGKHGPSYLTVSYDEAQKLVDKYAGRGTIVLDRKGKWVSKEAIHKHTKPVGVYVDHDTGEETVTSTFWISYSKTGTHIVPTLPLKW